MNNVIKEYLIKKYFKKANENIDLSRNKEAIKYLDKILFLDKNNIDAIVSKEDIAMHVCIIKKNQ